MNLHVVAYPNLAAADHDLIQAFRRNYNSLYMVIDPHFTIVFSVPDWTAADFIMEIKKQVAGTDAIRFCIRCAAINKDAIGHQYDAFLVPDEGFSGITRLHDRLYGDKLAYHHRLDIPYIPHISIANSPDAAAIKALVDQWNSQDRTISGTMSSLDIIDYTNRKVTTIEKIALPSGR